MTAPEHRGPWDDCDRHRTGNTAPGRLAPTRHSADKAFFTGRKEPIHLPTLAAWLIAFGLAIVVVTLLAYWIGTSIAGAFDDIAPTALDTTRHGSIEATMVWAEGGQ